MAKKPPARSSPKVFGYTRVSTSEQARYGDSLTTQRGLIVNHARRLRMKIALTFTDEGVSGGIPLEKRPQGKELLRVAQPGDTIIASKLDRMFRSAYDALRVADQLRKRAIGLRLLDVMGGDDITTGDGMARAFFRMASVFANLESDRIGERIRDVKFLHRSQQKFLGGYAPFGFKNVRGRVEKEPTEQQAIHMIRRLRARHHRGKTLSLRDIAEAVDQQFPAIRKLRKRPPGKPGISHMTVGEVLKRRD